MPILTNYDGVNDTIFQFVPTCKNKDCADPLPCYQAIPEEDHGGQDGEELPDQIDILVFSISHFFVINDLVVVMMEQGNGPKSETVMKMKNCPKADATEKDASSQRTEG